MAYDPSLSLAMIESQRLYEEMLSVGHARGVNRDIAMAAARRRFVKLGVMLQNLPPSEAAAPRREPSNVVPVRPDLRLVSIFAEHGEPDPPEAA